MELAFISGILATVVSFFGLLFAILTVRRMNNRLESFTDIADIFRMKKSEDGEVLIDERLGSLIGAFSSKLSESLRMSFLGGLSGQARLEKGLKGAIAQDVVENKMPIINLIGDFMGINTKKYISKHPEALGQIMQMAGPYLKGLNLGPNGANPGSSGREGVGYSD